MNLHTAQPIADRVRDLLAPHCDRIEIAGSIRRQKADVGDIEIVAIPKTVTDGDLFGGAGRPRRMDGMLCSKAHKVPVREERDLFDLIRLPWVDPKWRTF
jgi:DNA polymerase/3'-5' exonuclease PolX